MDLLKVQNLKMYYQTSRGPVKAVDDVSFEVRATESLGLAGESGCGKTSAALCIMKLLPSNAKIISGNITLEDTDILKLSETEIRKQIRWKKVSMVFQGAMNALHPTYNIGSQIAEAIFSHEDISKEEAAKRAGMLLELVGLDASLASRYPHELSGGMKQRTVTAMALACNPVLLIADEPTTALDVIVATQVLKAIIELRKKLDLSMILITHDLSVIAETCTKVAVMYAGKIVEQGDIISIYKEPLHPYTKDLITAFPSVIGDKKELASIPGSPPDLLEPPPGCRFHPRCSHAMEICRKEEPVLNSMGKERLVACHLVG